MNERTLRSSPPRIWTTTRFVSTVLKYLKEAGGTMLATIRQPQRRVCIPWFYGPRSCILAEYTQESNVGEAFRLERHTNSAG